MSKLLLTNHFKWPKLPDHERLSAGPAVVSFVSLDTYRTGCTATQTLTQPWTRIIPEFLQAMYISVYWKLMLDLLGISTCSNSGRSMIIQLSLWHSPLKSYNYALCTRHWPPTNSTSMYGKRKSLTVFMGDLLSTQERSCQGTFTR